MPGSRPQEVERMLPVLTGTAEKLGQEGNWRFAVAAVEGDIDSHSYTAKCSVPIEIVYNKTRQLIADSRLVITSSGTATLEIGLIGRPMVVIYRTGWLTYQIARRLIHLDKIALINITAGRKIVPELIQDEASIENITTRALTFLTDENLSCRVVEELSIAADHLGSPGGAARAADQIMELVGC
jgi:lipid-A-disaccharide synthase